MPLFKVTGETFEVHTDHNIVNLLGFGSDKIIKFDKFLFNVKQLHASLNGGVSWLPVDLKTLPVTEKYARARLAELERLGNLAKKQKRSVLIT